MLAEALVCDVCGAPAPGVLRSPGLTFRLMLCRAHLLEMRANIAALIARAPAGKR